MIYSPFPSSGQCLAASGASVQRVAALENKCLNNQWPPFLPLAFITEGDITLQEHPWRQLRSAVLAVSPPNLLPTPSPPGLQECGIPAQPWPNHCCGTKTRHQCRTAFCEER